MPNAAVIATQLTTPDSKPYRLFVAGTDVLTGASSGVPIESLEWDVSGSFAPGTMLFQHWDPLKAFSIPGHAEVRLWDQAAGEDLFGGYLIARESNPAFATGRVVEMRATDWSLQLDRNIVLACSYPAGLADQAVIQSLCGRFLIGDLTYAAPLVASTGTLPAMTFEIQSLRSALEQVALAANDDDLGERLLWVDPQKRINYRRAPKTGAAPYVIVDGTPAGGQKAVTDLQIVDDDSDIVTAVYVKGRAASGSGWVTTGVDGAMAQYGWRAEVLDVPDGTSRGQRNAYGKSYLRTRSRPVRRGSFSIVGTTGWKADQVVTISSTNLGLSSATFDIKHVSVEVLTGTPTFRHTIEFGAVKPGRVRSKSRFRVIVKGIGKLP